MLLLLFLICDDVVFSDVINDCQYQLVLAGRESATSNDYKRFFHNNVLYSTEISRFIFESVS